MNTTNNNNNGLEPHLIQAFKDKHPEFSSIIQAVVDDTKYFKTDEVIDGIRAVVKQHFATTKYKNIFVLKSVESGSHSDGWIYDQVKDLLPTHLAGEDMSVIEGLDLGDEPIQIIMLDDWSLSGVSLSGRLDEALYYHKNVNATCTVITFIGTGGADDCIHWLCDSYKNISNLTVLSHIQIKDFSLPNIDETLVERYLKVMRPETRALAYPVHLEYKVSNSFGSFSEVYNACRKDGGKAAKPY